ncbi:MAG: GTPase Era [Bacteroidetes bacterium]|nr:GTPase Era [Bacteroidota bacterium]MBS1628516.1 GTPase Era [Bacteroidota bacterium]
MNNSGFKAGFVNIFGPPNAGKSSLMNALLGEQLAIVSPKVQTTRHRILGILNEPGMQIIFSDTPGIIEPKYKLHQKMMLQVKNALEDADLALLISDITESPERFRTVAEGLHLKVPTLLLINKTDLIKDQNLRAQKIATYQAAFPEWDLVPVSAHSGEGLDTLMGKVRAALPEAPAYFPDDDISDRPTRFFVAEMVREQIYALFQDEIPYHTAVIIQSFETKPSLDVIKAEIIVSRETQKMILLGKGGKGIKELGIRSRKKMEEFLQRKVHLELFVKVRPKWRDNEAYLREYGYDK